MTRQEAEKNTHTHGVNEVTVGRLAGNSAWIFNQQYTNYYSAEWCQCVSASVFVSVFWSCSHSALLVAVLDLQLFFTGKLQFKTMPNWNLSSNQLTGGEKSYISDCFGDLEACQSRVWGKTVVFLPVQGMCDTWIDARIPLYGRRHYKLSVNQQVITVGVHLGGATNEERKKLFSKFLSECDWFSL